MTEKKIGKISEITFGHCGYQDACIGVSFILESEQDHWGVGDSWGDWSFKRSETAKWTEEERLKHLGQVCLDIAKLLEQAKVDTLDKLKGKPVEVTFEGNILKSWRLLTEAL